MELRPYEEKTVRKRGTGYFWWSLLLLLLAAACFTSWLGSFYVVGHPENPRCYRLLKDLKRLDPPKRFPVTDAPRGDFYSPARLLDRFGRLGPAELEHKNAELLRAYIMNYRETKESVVYVTGKYEVVEPYPMGVMDIFPGGVALIAQSIEHPQLILEALFTAPPATVKAIRESLPVGSDVSLERSRDLFALVHVERFADGRMQFTAIPLAYGKWRIQKRTGDSTPKFAEVSLRSPEELEKVDPKFTLNIDAGLPVIRGDRLTKGLDAYASFRRKALASAGDDQATLAKLELVRYEAVRPPPPPTKSPDDPAASAHAPPVTGPRTGTVGAVTPRPLPSPAPPAPLPPRPIVVRAQAPVVPPVPPPPVPGTTAAANPTAPTPAQPTITPAPPVQDRRVLTASQASSLVEQFQPAAQTLLAGDFVVTGVRGQRVAMRTRESLRDAGADPKRPGSNAALIVVDFPPGQKPPAKDSSLSRNGENGFEIRDVIRTPDGQITIVAADRG